LTTVCSSPACDFTQHNGYLCRNCNDTLTRNLKAIPWLLEELEVTLSRQDCLSESSDRSSDDQPLPLNMRAVEVRIDLNAVLAAWALHVAGKHEGLLAGVVWTELRLAQYLLEHVGDILTDPAAGQCADEIGDIRRRAQRAIDKPVQQVFAGPCGDCGKDLYAHPSKAEVKCRNPECGAIYPLDERRRWLLGKAEDQLRTATDLSRALSGLLGEKLTASMIRAWAHQGRLAKHPPLPDRPKDPTYKVGDVIDLCNEQAEKEAERAARRSRQLRTAC
jgi:hypothetical protein